MLPASYLASLLTRVRSGGRPSSLVSRSVLLENGAGSTSVVPVLASAMLSGCFFGFFFSCVSFCYSGQGWFLCGPCLIVGNVSALFFRVSLSSFVVRSATPEIGAGSSAVCLRISFGDIGSLFRFHLSGIRYPNECPRNGAES